MKLENPKITMLINPEYTEIEIHDSVANIKLAKVTLTPAQLSLILSRQGFVDCECQTGDLTKIGKMFGRKLLKNYESATKRDNNHY